MIKTYVNSLQTSFYYVSNTSVIFYMTDKIFDKEELNEKE